VGVGRPVDGVGGVHRLSAEGGGGILDQGDVIPEFHAEAAGRFDTRVRNHADQDDVANAVLLELKIEIGIREARSIPNAPRQRHRPAGAGSHHESCRPQLSLANTCALAEAS